MRTLFLGLLILASASAPRAEIVSAFDTDLDGWTAANASVFEWRNTDGNPPGMLYFDNTEGNLGFIFAPAKFLGDLTAFVGGTIAFDGRLLGTGGSFFESNGADYGSITMSGGGGSATRDLLPGGAVAPTDGWQTYTATLIAADWGKSDAEFAGILANVTGISIGVEALFGPEIQGIDNVRLTAVPLPSALWLLSAGMAGVLARSRRRKLATE